VTATPWRRQARGRVITRLPAHLNLHWFGNINQMIAAVSGALALWLGIGMVLDGVFTVGMLIAFTAYSGQFGAREPGESVAVTGPCGCGKTAPCLPR